MKNYVIAKLRARPKDLIGRLTIFRIGRAKNVTFLNRIHYTDHAKLYLNICIPKKSCTSPKRPAFIYLHGGGWVSGNPYSRISFISNITAKGFVTFSIFYGYAPENGHPVAVENIYKALDFIIKNHKHFNIDLKKVFVGGESAGAYLSSVLGAISSNDEYKQKFNLKESSKNLTFAGLILNCGIFDLETAILSGFKHIESYVGAYSGKSINEFIQDKERRFLSPINFITKNFPKTLVISAQHDKLASQSYALCQALAEHEVTHFHFHGTGNEAVHGFTVVQYLRPTKLAMQKIYEFMGV